jgi:hypothetical protein
VAVTCTAGQQHGTEVFGTTASTARPNKSGPSTREWTQDTHLFRIGDVAKQRMNFTKAVPAVVKAMITQGVAAKKDLDPVLIRNWLNSFFAAQSLRLLPEYGGLDDKGDR